MGQEFFLKKPLWKGWRRVHHNCNITIHVQMSLSMLPQLPSDAPRLGTLFKFPEIIFYYTIRVLLLDLRGSGENGSSDWVYGPYSKDL